MNKVLVANRGEIAVRIIRSLELMGITSVAVYSEADRKAPHVLMADEAFFIGPSPSSESYLKMDKIISIAKEIGAEGIHPGYGFLSENAEFARKVEEAGITFIGPSPASIEKMGSKLKAKETVQQYDIPMVPGSPGAISSAEEAEIIAKEIGFPVLIKASAGGGGKGMRIVQNASELSQQLKRAMSEALSSFGDESVFVEKYVSQPRHIEVQILADKHGNTVHLFERECSIQRRHQKVIEEAPSAILTPELRDKIGMTAVNVARSTDYTGAGTVEFLMDENHNYYFLEMNTRLQVEHPVTEMITGLDLVEWQIRVARGEKLPWTQDQLSFKGHAIELRVYAEDPENDFLPGTGTLTKYTQPTGEGIRVDDGFREGMEVPIFYDPMISKLVAYGTNRSEAIERLSKAIEEYQIEGIKTTLPFGTFVLDNDAFKSGNFDTHFVKNEYEKIEKEDDSIQEAGAKAALAFFFKHRELIKKIQ